MAKRRPNRLFLKLALPGAGVVLGSVVAYFIFLNGKAPSDGSPSWSPDGSKIAFYSERDGNSEIHVMDADGSHRVQLTHNPGSDGYPNFSPDGKRIVFDSDRDGNFEIYSMDAGGANVTRLTRDAARDVSASWSPDGRQIAFMSDRTGGFEIWVMNADGSDPRKMTACGSAWFPRWSPDGTKLAFHIGRDVHVLDLKSSALARLTSDPENGMYPDWSPDGKAIVFMSWRGGPTDIFTMSAKGANPHQVTHTRSGDMIDPRWSPDGKRIVFVQASGGTNGTGPQIIYSMNADGSDIRRLSH